MNVVYDSVGLTTFEKSLNCLKPRGLMALFGQSSGPVPPFDPQILNAKGSLFVTRPGLAHYLLTREELLRRAGDVLGWAASGKLKLRIDRVYPLAEAAAAHRDLEGRGTAGKLLLVPRMTLQAKLTVGAVLLTVLIVGVISAVDLGNVMRLEFNTTLERAELMKTVAATLVGGALNRQRTVSVREALKRSGVAGFAGERADRVPRDPGGGRSGSAETISLRTAIRTG